MEGIFAAFGSGVTAVLIRLPSWLVEGRAIGVGGALRLRRQLLILFGVFILRRLLFCLFLGEALAYVFE